MNENNRIARRDSRSLLLFLLTGAGVIWTSGVLIPLFSELLVSASPLTYYFLKRAYGSVCHQRIEHSFLFGGSPLFVCARCSGIYAAGTFFLMFSLFIPILRKRVKLNFIVLLFLPMLLDVIFYSSGIYQYNKTAAFITGLSAGTGCAILMINFLFSNNWNNQ